MTAFENHKNPSARVIDQHDHMSEEEVQKALEYYKAEVMNRTRGPQLEGIEDASLEEALRNDPNIIFVEVHNDANETLKWPLLVPIEHHIDYSQRFFADHYPDQPSYIFTLPPYNTIEELSDIAEKFAPVAERLKEESAVIAYDYLEGGGSGEVIPEYLSRLLAGNAEIQDITLESKWGDTTYGLPKVVHFEGYVEPVNVVENPVRDIQEALVQMVGRGEIAENPQDGISYLTAEKLRANDGELLRQIWSIYSDQFDTLTEDHPSLQKQPQEELERMLLADDAVNIAYIEDGRVAGLLYFVHNMENCVWLNKKFYDDRYNEADGWLAYYPGIVVAKEKARQGSGYAQAMMACLADAAEATGKKMILTCQCTNISMTYIPKIAASVIEAHPKLRMLRGDNGDAFTQTAEYNYKVMQVT